MHWKGILRVGSFQIGTVCISILYSSTILSLVDYNVTKISVNNVERVVKLKHFVHLSTCKNYKINETKIFISHEYTNIKFITVVNIEFKSLNTLEIITSDFLGSTHNSSQYFPKLN